MKLQAWVPDGPNFIDAGPAIDFQGITNLYPTSKGYAVLSTPQAIGSALPAACLGAASVLKLAGTRRVFAATTDTIYELQSGVWTDVTAPALTATSSSRYLFAQFGDATIATNDADQLMVATSGNFAAIANSPKARIVFSVPNFVICLNTQDGSGSTAFGDGPDRWWCSGFQDHTNWTPALSTQCASGRLIGGGGQLTAGAKFGNGFVAYKEREMWLANYVGSPAVFQFIAIPGDVGCVGPEAVVDIGGAHIFVGSDNIWMFDGTRPRSIADQQVRDEFFEAIPNDQLVNTRAVFDRDRMLVWFFANINSTYAGATTKAFFYHLQSGRWGNADITAECPLVYYEPGITWATVATTYPTWDDLDGISWDSNVWYPGNRTMAYFDTSHQLQGLTGAAASNASFTTKAIGIPAVDSCLGEVQLRGNVAGCAVTAGMCDGSGQILAYTDTIQEEGGKVRLNSVGRYHFINVSMPPGASVWGMDVKLTPAGNR